MRGDNCGSSTESAFCKVFDFIQIYLTFFNLESQIMFCNVDQRTTGDGWKNAAGLWSYNSAVFGYEDEVGTTGLFNLCSGCRVKIHIFVIALTMCIHDRMETHCIIKAGFDVSCSMRCGTVEICDTDSDWFCTAFKVWSYRCGKDTELIFVSRFYADYRVASKHIRTYIQGSS